MNWQEVCNHPSLRDLPFKIETNEWGQIVMSPATNRHSYLQGQIEQLLRQMRTDGTAFPECAIETERGVKVADVAWLSDAFLKAHGLESPYTAAPELCVEVRSASNSRAEMDEKRGLYLARGALEVWFCGDDGQLRFHDAGGQIAESRLFPGLTQVPILPFLRQARVEP